MRPQALFWATVVALLVTGSDASIFKLEDREIEMGKRVTWINEMPMFARKDSPFWIGGLSDPLLAIRATLSLEDPDDAFEEGQVLRVVHGWSDEMIEPVMEYSPYSPCQDDIEIPFDGWEQQFVTVSARDDSAAELSIDVKFEVKKTGFHVLMLTNCIGDSLLFTGEFVYMNPYGYLSGWSFGLLPMAGFLSLGYTLLAGVYITLCIINREYILGLQKAIVLVILMGFTERFAQFLTYLEMNSSGAKSCCPMRADLTFSSALNVLKRSSSALLLLAVALGFGVVKPRLDRSTYLKILVLGVVYTFSSLVLDLQRIADISKNGRQTEPLLFMSLIVSICDVTILFWIYFGISNILSDLKESKQLAKLKMYQSLARALFLWALTWLIFTLLEIFVVEGQIALSWRYWYLLVSFWDLFFLGILMQICYIWRPSPLTQQYAFSHQLPTSEDLDEFDQVGLEMHQPDTAADFAIGDDDDNDDDDDDIEGLGQSIGGENMSSKQKRKDKLAID